MNIRLGDNEMSVGRYLALWTAVALVFAVQGFLQDVLLDGHVWALTDYLRWSMVQWYTWAGLAPWVFRIARNTLIDYWRTKQATAWSRPGSKTRLGLPNPTARKWRSM